MMDLLRPARPAGAAPPLRDTAQPLHLCRRARPAINLGEFSRGSTAGAMMVRRMWARCGVVAAVAVAAAGVAAAPAAAVDVANDPFSRTLANGWGGAPLGGLYTILGTPASY